MMAYGLPKIKIAYKTFNMIAGYNSSIFQFKSKSVISRFLLIGLWT